MGRACAPCPWSRAGLSVREIADILGWSNDKVERLLDRYVKRDGLFRDRIRRMDEFESRTKTAKPIPNCEGEIG
jgi:hypothetical protein